MILALGIDSVEIERFELWNTYNQKKLMRFFSQSEITYCLSIPEKSAERFAVRFATKEALFKALCQSYPEQRFYLHKVAKACEVQKKTAAPRLLVDWQALNLPKLTALISLTHTRQIASAAVILQK
ncbi:MAG: 4'-phosphopantetheinyl transferase superfamily protein [Candidatus Babeliaceae bacterium]|nr:4'-phosphopantetheinyl transferase superfamily protein [Candidatus Babeliaceae bacterium]